ncbi:MAG TPA: DUF1203 domain-containing protein [Brevundimonas sp.]|jgi:hypothetical protein
MTYRILPLSLEPFANLFALSDDELLDLGARRMTAEKPNSSPCRVSLCDAEPGEQLILAHHVHVEDPSSPYRSGGAIFIREGASEASLSADTVPEMLSRRQLSVRAYDDAAMMVSAEVVEGVVLHDRLLHWFADPSVSDVHIHTANRGCYLARADRAD